MIGKGIGLSLFFETEHMADWGPANFQPSSNPDNAAVSWAATVTVPGDVESDTKYIPPTLDMFSRGQAPPAPRGHLRRQSLFGGDPGDAPRNDLPEAGGWREI